MDVLATFETSAAVIHGTQAPTRYAVRQVLDQELQKTKLMRDATSRQARFRAGGVGGAAGGLLGMGDHLHFGSNKENAKAAAAAAKQQGMPAVRVKKDFFGRIIKTEARPLQEGDGNSGDEPLGKAETKVWVTFHEGLNNAVRKPLMLDELMRGL